MFADNVRESELAVKVLDQHQKQKKENNSIIESSIFWRGCEIERKSVALPKVYVVIP